MKKLYAFITVCLMLILISAPMALAQPCPEPGSGAGGVAEFAAACTSCEYGPVPTCNDEFTIELLGIDRDLVRNFITFTYEVYKPLSGPDPMPDLNHWVLGVDLERFQKCLAKGKTLSDLFVECTVGVLNAGIDCGLAIPDPKTQLDGVRFEKPLRGGVTRAYSVTLDEGALAVGFEIADDCIVAAMVAGDQDIQRAHRLVPGYACVIGPVCVGEPPEFICPRSQGYWKNHLSAWPVDSIMLGDKTYTKEEARAIMRTPTRGDASIILARQLIAAKLNIENGANPDPVTETIDAADDLLATFPGRLPLDVRTFTEAGKKMLRYAKVLDAYNNGWLTPNCIR